MTIQIHDYIGVDLYTKPSDRTDRSGWLKAWCIFRHPSDGVVHTAYGPLDPQAVIDNRIGVVTKLTLRSVNQNGDAMVRAKCAKGYSHEPNRYGFYLDLDTGQLIDTRHSPRWVVDRLTNATRSAAGTASDPVIAPSVEERSKPSVTERLAGMGADATPEWF